MSIKSCKVSKTLEMKKIISSVFLIISVSAFSQEIEEKYNYEGLTKFTIGVHNTNYNKASFDRVNPTNTATFDLKPIISFFVDYRLLSYKNHAIKVGVFLNKFKNDLRFRGVVYDNVYNQEGEVNGEPYPFENKMTQYEFYLNYSYLLKINKKWFIELSTGISYEKNDSYFEYTQDVYFSEFGEDGVIIPYQHTYSDIFFLKKDNTRYHFSPSISYKIDSGMFNFGMKYSIPFKGFLYGQYEFYNDSGENQSIGFFSMNGEYLSFTLSFKPSKSLFKTKNKAKLKF